MAKPSQADPQVDDRPLPQDFETALAELESLVAAMEDGSLPLEQSLAAYRRGVELTRVCQDRLAQAEQQVKVLEGDCCARWIRRRWTTNKTRMKQTQLAFPEWLQGRVRHVEDVLDDLLPRPTRCPRACTKPCATPRWAAASACARRWSTRPARPAPSAAACSPSRPRWTARPRPWN